MEARLRGLPGLLRAYTGSERSPTSCDSPRNLFSWWFKWQPPDGLCGRSKGYFGTMIVAGNQTLNSLHSKRTLTSIQPSWWLHVTITANIQHLNGWMLQNLSTCTKHLSRKKIHVSHRSINFHTQKFNDLKYTHLICDTFIVYVILFL